MKSLLRNSALLLSALLCLTSSMRAQAADEIPSPSPSPSPSTVALTPDDLRSLMVDGNFQMLTGLNQVYQAKDQVRVARNNLLPGANLSAILGTISGPSFILSSVEFLVPFLIPSNWFNYKASEANFDAETLSYRILELNEYASVYALYETVVLDENLKAILVKQYADWNDIVTYLNAQNAVTGTVSQQDLETAQSEADSAAAQVSAMQQFVAGDVAQLRLALGLPLSTDIIVDPSDPRAVIKPSPTEKLDVATAAKQAEDISPEATQLEDLVAAGNMGSWSDTFAWLGGVGFMAGNPYSPGGSTAPDLTSGQFRGSMSLGFAAFPQYSLDQDKTDAIQISLNELNAQMTETLESVLSGVKASTVQVAALQDAENQMNDSYALEKFKYDHGQSNIENLLTIRNQVTQAATARANAQGQLDQLRITLERTMLEGPFAELPGCSMTAAPSENVFQKIWDAISSIFSSGQDHATLQQVCQYVPQG